MVNVDVPMVGPRTAPPAESVAVGGRHRRLGTWIANGVGLVFALIIAFPAYWMVNTAFKPPNEVLTFTPLFLPHNPTFANFRSALSAPSSST
jgi:N,N'-diacetylchitobiose transport system permease protein